MSKRELIPAENVTTAIAVQPPSVETMLMHAIDMKVDPAAMRELVTLQREIAADRAKSEFVEALQGFQNDCPPISRNNKPQGAKFTYADLPHIAETIRPYLDKWRLSYTFDTSVQEKQITATCKVQHQAGHSESSSFTGPVCGTSAMSQIQMAASTISYGKRHALVMALGITILGEDDERNLPQPPDRPDQRSNTPKAQPRADRVTSDDLKNLMALWKDKRAKAHQANDIGAWGTWVESNCGIAPEYSRNVTYWTREKLNAAFIEVESWNV